MGRGDGRGQVGRDKDCIIVVHPGGVEGWVEGAGLVFKSKTNPADYHDEMNSEHYIEQLTKQLLR